MQTKQQFQGKISMKKILATSALAVTIALTGCTATDTTNGGAVGVQRKQYMFSMLSEQEVNDMYAQSYAKTLQDAQAHGALVSKNDKQMQRLQAIANRLIAQVSTFRPEAANWKWDVNLIRSDEVNANCGPGGKIIFYTGILDSLKLTDDEIAAVMGHEIAHALREHGREAMSKAYAVNAGSELAGILGAKTENINLGQMGVQYLMTLPNSRTNENEADLIGLELAARAGYNPEAAINLWKKMSAAGGGSIPEFMSTHPANESRIASLQAAMPKVLPLYEAAKKNYKN